MVVREDVWANGTCLVCQAKFTSDAERNQHENESTHKKELQIRLPSNIDSLLFERYSRANAAVPGLDCICELKFSWATTSFWVCTVCYEVGTSLDSADPHVYGCSHRENYLSVHCPDRYESLMAKLKSSPADEAHYIGDRAVRELLYESKCLSPPDVYIFDDCSKQWVFKVLGLDDNADGVVSAYLLEPISDYHQLVQCLKCGENFFAYEKPEQLQLAWHVHLSSSRHQHCQRMLTLLGEEQIEYKKGVPAYCHVKDDGAFNEFRGAHYGPTCGYEFLIDFAVGNECFCTLCFCVIQKHEATEHFSSEFHVERFARCFNPSKLLGAEYMKPVERHQILAEAVAQRGKYALTSQYRTHAGCMPRLLRQCAFGDRRDYPAVSLHEVAIGTARAVWCKECVQYIRLTDQDSWMDHFMDEEHFEYCTKRALYYLDVRNLVPNRAALAPFRKAAKGWTNKFCVILGRPLAVEDHCYYGLQYIVRDELSRVSVCLCCHFIANYDEEDAMSIHVRSFDHLARIMHLTNKKFLGVLWRDVAQECRKLYLLDYLKHCKLDAIVDSPIVYDPVSALNANCYGHISRWILELARMPPETREISLATLRLDDFTKDKVPFNLAMRQVNVEIRHIESSIVLFCQECNQAFSSTMENIKEKFAEHIFSLSHWSRQQSLMENRFDENKRVFGQTSCFVVNPYVQTNDKKKVTWKWNEQWHTFEFVYAQLGLSDIRERRNLPKTKRDLYCNLCAESFKASKLELERHVRSIAHVFYYVHSHRFQAIPEIEAALLVQEDLPTKHKNLRRLLAKTMRDLEKEQGELSIYDMSMKFCELPEVKLVIESDGNGEVVTPQKLLKDGVHNHEETDEECDAFAINACDFDKTSAAEIQQRLVFLINKAGTDETDLDCVKRQIMTVTLTGEGILPSVIDGDASTAASSAENRIKPKKATDGRNSGQLSSQSAASPVTSQSTSTVRSTLASSVPSSERDRGVWRPPPAGSTQTLSISQKLKQYGDVINRISNSSTTAARVDDNQTAKGKNSNDALNGSAAVRRPGSNGRQRSPTPLRDASHRRPPSSEDSRRTRSSAADRDERRNPSYYSQRDNDRTTSSSRNGRSSNTDTSRQSTKRCSDTSPPKLKSGSKPPAEEPVKSKVSFKITLSENSTAQKEIRNATTDPPSINKDVSAVDPYAEDDRDLIIVSKSALANKQPSITRVETPISSEEAHVKAIQDFLKKTVEANTPATTTTMTSAIPPDIPTLPMGMNPTALFGPMSIGMMPPPPFLLPPFGSIPSFPPGAPFMNPPFPGSIPPFMPPPQAGASSEEMLLRAKMELCMKDLFNIKTTSELIDYMWNQGFDKIAPTEKPLLFNAVAKKRRGLLGCNMLYQIICYEHPELETYYCGLCNHWTTVSEMFNHLIAPLHRLNYMHRHYKVYHRRATEEYNGATRNQFLEQMADHIWDLEGSGECRNRMRCVLNEAAIMRIWPNVVNNIDHSWKILDFEMKTEVTVPLTAEAPARSSPELAADVNVELEPTKTAKSRDTTSRKGSVERRDSRNAAKSKISREDERSSRTERRERESRITSSRDHRTSDRRSPSPRRRRERSRSPVRRHQSRSPRRERNERDRRRESPTAERKRRRSRSPRTTRPETQKSKSPKSPFREEPVAKKKSETWDEKAAAFLDRIGNRKDAARLYFASVDNTNARNEPCVEPDSPTFGGKHRLPSSDVIATSSSTSATRSHGEKSVEERLRGTVTRLAHSDRAANEVASELERMAASSMPGPTSKDHRPQKSRFEPAGRSSGTKPTESQNGDNKAEMRKVIGVIVELQSIFEAEKRIDGEVIFKVCEDMGIAAKDALVNTLLRETAQMYQLDLATAYEEWITRKLLEAQQQQQRKLEQEKSQSQGGLSFELMDILRKVNMAQQPASTTANAFAIDHVNDVGFGGRRQPYEPELNADVNFVYNGDDFREDEAAGPAPDFQRFSDEESDVEPNNDLSAGEMEKKRAALQSFAEAKGLRPEIAAAAAAAAIQQQIPGKKKKEKKMLKQKKPNPNLEPLGNTARVFGANFAGSGSGAPSQVLQRQKSILGINSSNTMANSRTNNGIGSGTSFAAAAANFAALSFLQQPPPPPVPTPKAVGDLDSEHSNIPFDVKRALQNFQCAVNPIQKQQHSAEKISGLTTLFSGFYAYSASSPSATSLSLAGAPVNYTSPQRLFSFTEQQRQQQTQRALHQQDATPVYQRNTPQLSHSGSLKVPPSVVRKPQASAAAPAVNANVIDLASQVGDDWGSMNSYLSNLLKNPKTGAASKK